MNLKTPQECPECGGTFEQQSITYEERDERGVFYLVENVPAWVCSQCGTIYLDADVDKILDALIDTESPVKRIETPVFDFAQTKS